MLGVHVLPVYSVKYVLCFAGRKRRTVLYDVLSPTGEQIGNRLPWDDAVLLARLHYVKTATFPKRKSVPKKEQKPKPKKPSNTKPGVILEDFTDLDNIGLASKCIEQYLLEDYPRAKINPW